MLTFLWTVHDPFIELSQRNVQSQIIMQKFQDYIKTILETPRKIRGTLLLRVLKASAFRNLIRS